MIQHVFFDLDNTLWDFEKNSRITLLSLIKEFNLIKKGVNNPEEFINRYKIHNEVLWGLYRVNKIKKEELREKRFLLTLKEYGINDPKLAREFGLKYIKKSPLKKELFPFAIKVLRYLEKRYTLHIITNGFQEVQHIKLKSSNLSKYFKNIITSEEIGIKKPDKKIFQYALKKAKAKSKTSVMIGDDLLVDIHGAEEAGIRGIYFNPKKIKHSENIQCEIFCLSELMNLL